jgi:hypothetical protein
MCTFYLASGCYLHKHTAALFVRNGALAVSYLNITSWDTGYNVTSCGVAHSGCCSNATTFSVESKLLHTVVHHQQYPPGMAQEYQWRITNPFKASQLIIPAIKFRS